MFQQYIKFHPDHLHSVQQKTKPRGFVFSQSCDPQQKVKVTRSGIRDRNGGKSKNLRVGVQGPYVAPNWVQGQQSWWGGQRAKPPEAKGFFLNLRYEKPHFLALYPVSNSHSQCSLLCFKAFFQRNKPGLDKGLYPKTLYS